MDTTFRPTHEIFDASGESRGLYRRDNSTGFYTDAATWFDGGKPLHHNEIEEWGWKVKQLSSLFREHYAAVHGEDGSDCPDGCDSRTYVRPDGCSCHIGSCEDCA